MSKMIDATPFQSFKKKKRRKEQKNINKNINNNGIITILLPRLEEVKRFAIS